MAYEKQHCKVFFLKAVRAKKKLEFQFVLLASSSHILLAWDNFLLALVNDFVCGYLAWEGGGGVFLGILGGEMPPGSPNDDPISDQKMSFSTPVFRPAL